MLHSGNANGIIRFPDQLAEWVLLIHVGFLPHCSSHCEHADCRCAGVHWCTWIALYCKRCSTMVVLLSSCTTHSELAPASTEIVWNNKACMTSAEISFGRVRLSEELKGIYSRRVCDNSTFISILSYFYITSYCEGKYIAIPTAVLTFLHSHANIMLNAKKLISKNIVFNSKLNKEKHNSMRSNSSENLRK